MAGSSKKEKIRAKKAQKLAAKQQQSASSSSSSSNNNNAAVQFLPPEEFHKMILQVDEQKAAQLKLYALGSRVAFSEDDSDVVQRSRKLFKDAAPSFMNDYGLWILSRSLVKKGFNGNADDDALEFGAYDPLECLREMPLNVSDGVCCAEIFLFFAIDGDVPGDDLNSRESVMDFLSALNSTEGTRKIHAFSVAAASVTTTREKLNELRGKHLTGVEKPMYR